MFAKTFVSLLATSLILVTISTASISTAVADVPGYWTTKSGEVWRDDFGQCWRTRFWKPEHAITECEAGVSAESDKDSVSDTKDGDVDNDGIADSMDRCPETPAGSAVDATGCKLVVQIDSDSDGDSVADSNDRCPGTPAGVEVNASGCEKDSDLDGIVDSRDQCSNTISGQKVDANGCALEEIIVLRGVTFETNSDELKGDSPTVLNEVAKTLKRYPKMVVEVAGYADSRGTESLNKELSQKRANSTINYLISQGVSPDSLKAKGYGEDEPIADNNTSVGRAKNRRVDFISLIDSD